MSGCSTKTTCTGSHSRPPAPDRPRPRRRRSTTKLRAGPTRFRRIRRPSSRRSSPTCSSRGKGLEAGTGEGHTDPRAEKGFCMIGGGTPLRAVAGVSLCLLLAVCAAPATTEVHWVKTGADDETISRELRDCNSQANAALASERGINQDINATLGGNWQFSGTSAIEHQSMGAQAAGYADQVLNNCMRDKGFSKQS